MYLLDLSIAFGLITALGAVVLAAKWQQESVPA